MARQYCPYGLTHVRVPIVSNKKGDITSLNQLGILGELFSEFAFALHFAVLSSTWLLTRQSTKAQQTLLPSLGELGLKLIINKSYGQSGASHNLQPGHREEQSQKNQQRHAGQKHKKVVGRPLSQVYGGEA